MRGLYLITDHEEAALPTLLGQVEAALEGGARYLQYRAKTLTAARCRQEAGALKRRCERYRVPLIINDDLELAAELGCGVHLGVDDAAVAAARARLGPDAIIGATCHADLELARQAVAAGASYVAFGRFFPSSSKPAAPPAPLAVLTAAKAELPVPICAVGGIDAHNASDVLAAGADLIAVIAAVFAAPDIRAAARQLAGLCAE